MVKLLRLSRLNPLRLAFTSSPNIQWSFVWLRVLPLTFLTLVALIPAQYYITEDKFDLLMVLAIILFLPRPILVLRTMVTAIGTVHDEMRANRWDVLILTGIPARKIVWRKWVVVVKQTAFDHFVFSLVLMGLALAVAEFINILSVERYRYMGIVVSPYFYYADVFSPYQLYPSFTTFIIAIGIVGLFGLLECGLAASIGMTAAFTMKKLSFVNYLVSSSYFIGLGIIFFIIWLHLWTGGAWIKNYSIWYCYSQMYPCESYLLTTYAKAADTLALAIFAPIDQATLLSANIMRPYDDRWIELNTNEPTRLYKSTYDNRPFVARNVFAALLSVGLYALIIRYFLHRATRFAVINHGASGYLEL